MTSATDETVVYHTSHLEGSIILIGRPSTKGTSEHLPSVAPEEQTASMTTLPGESITHHPPTTWHSQLDSLESEVGKSYTVEAPATRMLQCPFDNIPNELVLRIISIANEEVPPGHHTPWSELQDARTSLGPHADSASRVCRRWFDITRYSKTTSHLWHFRALLNYSPFGDTIASVDQLPAFQQLLGQSRGHDLYVSFMWPNSDSATEQQRSHIAAVTLWILSKYHHQIASMVFFGTFLFMAPYLPEFTTTCERLHTIIVKHHIHRAHDDSSLSLYTWGGSLAPFSSLTQLDIQLTVGRKFDLSTIPCGPSIKRITMLLGHIQSPSERVDGATLVKFIHANPRLEHFETDIFYVGDPTPVSLSPHHAKFPSKIKSLSGEPHLHFLLFQTFLLHGLTTIDLKDDKERIIFLPAKHSIAVDSFPSLKRVNIPGNQRFLEFFTPFLTNREMEYLKIGGIRCNIGSLPFSASRELRLGILLASTREWNVNFFQQFTLPTLDKTEFLGLDLRPDPYGNPPGPEKKSNRGKMMAQLLSTIEVEIELPPVYDDGIWYALQSLFDDISAPNLSHLSLSLVIQRRLQLKMIILKRRPGSLGRILTKSPHSPDIIRLLHFNASGQSPDLEIRLGFGFLGESRTWLSDVVKWDIFSLLTEGGWFGCSVINLAVFHLFDTPWFSSSAQEKEIFESYLKSLMVAKKRVPSPIQRIVLVDEEGRMIMENLYVGKTRSTI